MSRINPEGQLTRAERLATVVAIAGAVLVHFVVILGWGRLSRWTQEEQKKERLMVIRRVRDVSPTPTAPPAPRERLAPGDAGGEGAASTGRKAAPPDPKVREPGPEPPKESELSPAMEEDLTGDEAAEPPPADEQGQTSVSVVTDLPASSFLLAGGAQQYRGSGTFWVRKGAPPGVYTVTFHPVAGFTTPPVQTKELAARGQIVFVGKYRRSTEIVVESNVPGARVTIFRPDGRSIDLTCPGRALLDDLPPGICTAVFKDIPGYVTPAPVSKSHVPGGKLSFFGEYRQSPLARAQETAAAAKEAAAKEAAAKEAAERDAAGGAAGTGGGKAGRSGAGGDTGSGRKRTGAAGPEEGGLDRRVQMVVKSYPATDIERGFEPIPYPEVIIRRSNFQQGWCQVYLIVDVDDDGGVRHITIERPHEGSRPQFEALIRAVEAAVRSWDYDKVQTEVHVDVRFYVE
jgi:hypothetical protein